MSDERKPWLDPQPGDVFRAIYDMEKDHVYVVLGVTPLYVTFIRLFTWKYSLSAEKDVMHKEVFVTWDSIYSDFQTIHLGGGA